ncbi:retron system putative HNH endonuclease [Halonatronum saccharophilum]|uniref:retron system putative HNH endonuclease n=1 Tax=Halonatronum saccharophilum TaxID=150060 RepID=UPI000485CC0F|nr:retron system putative HNH endonuclease [Halonatronum saccharophilum]
MRFIKNKGTIPDSLKSDKTNEIRKEVIKKQSYNSKHNNYYKKDDIKEKLKGVYENKCAYCEKSLLDWYPNVEHYRPKSIYYWLMFSWDNLLPACPQCNTNKGDKFKLNGTKVVYEEELLEEIHNDIENYNAKEKPLMINPEVDNVENKIKYEKTGKINSYDDRCKYTIDICKLNRDDLVERRKKVYDDFERRVVKLKKEFKVATKEEIKKDIEARIKQETSKFIENAFNEGVEFLLFRRYIAKEFLSEILR